MKAPYDERENPYENFSVEVNYLIRKTVNIKTDDYAVEHDDFERQAFLNTELTDWQSAYEESHYTISEMLEELERYVEREICVEDPQSFRGRHLKKLYNDVQGWEVVESEFVEQ